MVEMDEFLRSRWFWWALALGLFALEAMLPGTFMLWLGFAAVGVGLVTLVFGGLELWMQWVLFSVLSMVAVAMGWRWRRTHVDAPTDQPLLNRRAEQFVGRVVVLEGPLVNGSGRARLGDTLWSVSGPDLPGGARVRITAADGSRFVVVPVEL